MSSKWAYTNYNNTGNIRIIYCCENPSDQHPTGQWKVAFRTGETKYLSEITEKMLTHAADRSAYRAAMVNAQEAARNPKVEEACCVIS